MSEPAASPARASWVQWAARLVAAAALVVTVWVMATQSGAVIHGHPAYAVMLGVTAVGGVVGSWLAWRRRDDAVDRVDQGRGQSADRVSRARRRRIWARAGQVVLLALAVGWIAMIAWLRPFAAGETAVAAMASDETVIVSESTARIVLSPADGEPSTLGVFFQPGARVDARAYVPTLRTLAENGYVVVIVKQPLSIAFTALGSFDAMRPEYAEITSWVVGGHSLGGTVAAMQAVEGDPGPAPVTGLFFWASYPADSIKDTFSGEVASISGSRDGLATPDKIDASRADLPDDTVYTVIDGACHAQFGDYGIQPGDNTPTIDAEEARSAISESTLAFVQSLTS